MRGIFILKPPRIRRGSFVFLRRIREVPKRGSITLPFEIRKGRGFLLIGLLFAACGEPLGYLKIQFLREGGEDPLSTSASEFRPEADPPSDTTVYIRWEGPNRGALAVPFAAHRAEIKALPPGSYSLDLTLASQGKILFASTITAEVRAGETTTLVLPLGGLP